MLPHPTLSFTIPSIQDDLPLECRIYHPPSLIPGPQLQRSGLRKKAAIVAPPYAPLGGCYDDPVVGVVGSTILKEGFIVGTFNFRGVGNSKGRTSWSSRPEQDDYLSFIAFMIYYLHHLAIPELPEATESEHSELEDSRMHDLSPIPSQIVPPRLLDDGEITPGNGKAGLPPLESSNAKPEPLPPCLLLAGYSYGSMILSSLPPLSSIVLSQFQTPQSGSAFEEIRLRSLHLSTQQSDLISNYLSTLSPSQPQPRTPHSAFITGGNTLASPKLRKPNPAVRVGGDENSRRASHESYRSRNSFSIETPEKLRKSIDRVRSITRPNRHTSSSGSISRASKSRHQTSSTDAGATTSADGIDTIKPITDIIQNLKIAYILISPLQGLIHSLATMWTPPSSSSSKPPPTKSSKHKIHSITTLPENELKLITNPTLAIFGDDDVFVSAKKLRAWTGRLEDAAVGAEGGQAFTAREVKGAGHFWHDHEAVGVLREEVRGFVGGL